MTKHYVLVEIETTPPDDAGPLFDIAIADKIGKALRSHYHNSPRKFLTADVTDLMIDTPVDLIANDLIERLS